MANAKLTAISFLVCLTHSLSVWQLSELFFKRLKEEREKTEYWGPECDAGPFPNKRSLDGHISKGHRSVKKEFRENGVEIHKLNGIE